MDVFLEIYCHFTFDLHSVYSLTVTDLYRHFIFSLHWMFSYRFMVPLCVVYTLNFTLWMFSYRFMVPLCLVYTLNFTLDVFLQIYGPFMFSLHFEFHTVDVFLQIYGPFIFSVHLDFDTDTGCFLTDLYSHFTFGMSFEDEDGNEEYILWSDLLSAAEKLRRQVSVVIRLYP